MVVHSLTNNFPTIDASPTVVAIHQTGHDGNMAGHSNRVDRLINYGYAGKSFDYGLGWTSCSHFVTEWKENDVVLFHRKGRKEDKGCSAKLRRKGKDPNIYSGWKIV